MSLYLTKGVSNAKCLTLAEPDLCFGVAGAVILMLSSRQFIVVS